MKLDRDDDKEDFNFSVGIGEKRACGGMMYLGREDKSNLVFLREFSKR